MTMTDSTAASLLSDRDRSVPVAARASLGVEVLGSPGLYAVWVDEAGARDLSEGLGCTVTAGLVYVGQAGALSPGDTRPLKSTLATRWSQHMGADPWKSTLRRTLWAALGGLLGQPVVDERALTTWMGEHLAVSMVAVPDRRALDSLEDDVVTLLDPPFNLVPKSLFRTPTRLFLDANRLTRKKWRNQQAGGVGP